MDIFEFTRKWEGGLSRNPDDSAAFDPVPASYRDRLGWHTNKGVTWSTFKSLSGRLGYVPTPDLFFRMPDDIWARIAKNNYWDAFHLDKMTKKRTAICIFNWAWGSGIRGACSRLARFQRTKMGVVDTTLSNSEIVFNFEKSELTDKKLFEMLCDQREEDFRAMNKPMFLNGWLNQLNDFRKTFR